jgi:CheY-like chemotaxis protein
MPVRTTGKVLVVDDEPDLLEAAVTYLNEMGFTTYHAPDGPSALDIIRLHTDIDLIVTDIIMPGGMNGVELAQMARTFLPNMKLIYCSGFPSDAMVDRKMALVDAPLLNKPYQRIEFDAIVNAVMQGDGTCQT